MTGRWCLAGVRLAVMVVGIWAGEAARGRFWRVVGGSWRCGGLCGSKWLVLAVKVVLQMDGCI